MGKYPFCGTNPVWTPVKDRPDVHVTLQLTEGLFDGQQVFVIA
jgi:hypothetical protein